MANTTLEVVTDKPAIPKKVLHTPFSGDALPKLIGILGRLTDEQTAAATATKKHVALHPGKVRKLLIATADLAAENEDMVIDVEVNGVSILSATPQIVHDDTPVGVFDVTGLVLAGTVIAVGDVIEVIRTLTSGSTLTSTAVVLEWG